MQRFHPALAPVLAIAAILGGCHHKSDRERRVTQAWVRLPAVPGRPGAAYFVLTGNDRADRLVHVDSALVQRIELHEGGEMHGMMTMRPLASIDVPREASINFAPGGNHAMLFGIDKAIVPGTAIPLRFTYESGAAVEVEAKTVGPGGDNPYPAR